VFFEGLKEGYLFPSHEYTYAADRAVFLGDVLAARYDVDPDSRTFERCSASYALAAILCPLRLDAIKEVYAVVQPSGQGMNLQKTLRMHGERLRASGVLEKGSVSLDPEELSYLYELMSFGSVPEAQASHVEPSLKARHDQLLEDPAAVGHTIMPYISQSVSQDDVSALLASVCGRD
jgi:hypothetical protein